MIKDMIGREIKVGDFVVFYSNIYRVKGLGIEQPANSGHGIVWVMIWNAGRCTHQPVMKYSSDVVLLPMGDVLNWMLTQK
jgi:hypothetical protein